MSRSSNIPRDISSQISILKQYIVLCNLHKKDFCYDIITKFQTQLETYISSDILNILTSRSSNKNASCFGYIERTETLYACATCDPEFHYYYCQRCFDSSQHQNHKIFTLRDHEPQLCCCDNDDIYGHPFICISHENPEEEISINQKTITQMTEALSPLIIVICYCVACSIANKENQFYDCSTLLRILSYWSTNSSVIKKILTNLWTTSQCYNIFSGYSLDEIINILRIHKEDPHYILLISGFQEQVPPLDLILKMGITTCSLYEESFYGFCCTQFKDSTFYNYFYSHFTIYLLQLFQNIHDESIILYEPDTTLKSFQLSTRLCYHFNNKFFNYLMKRRALLGYLNQIQDFIQRIYQLILDLIHENKIKQLSFPFYVPYKDLYLFVLAFSCLTELSSKPKISHLFFCNRKENDCDPIHATISQSTLLFLAHCQEVVTMKMDQKESSYPPLFYLKILNEKFNIYQQFVYNIIELLRYKVHQCGVSYIDIYIPCLYQSLYYIQQYYERNLCEYQKDLKDSKSNQIEKKYPFDLSCQETNKDQVEYIHYVNMLNLFVELIFYDLYQYNINFTSLFIHPELDQIYPSQSISIGLKALFFYIVRILFADSYYDRIQYEIPYFLIINFSRKELFHFITLSELDCFMIQIFALLYSNEYVIQVLLHYFSFFRNSFLSLLYPSQTHSLSYVEYDSELHLVSNPNLKDCSLKSLFNKYHSIYEQPQQIQFKESTSFSSKSTLNLYDQFHKIYLKSSKNEYPSIQQENSKNQSKSSKKKNKKKSKSTKSTSTETPSRPKEDLAVPTTTENTSTPVENDPSPAPVASPTPIDISDVLNTLSDIGKEIQNPSLTSLSQPSTSVTVEEITEEEIPNLEEIESTPESELNPSNQEDLSLEKEKQESTSEQTQSTEETAVKKLQQVLSILDPSKAQELSSGSQKDDLLSLINKIQEHSKVNPESEEELNQEIEHFLESRQSLFRFSYNPKQSNPFNPKQRPINPKTGKPVPYGKKLKEIRKEVPKEPIEEEQSKENETINPNSEDIIQETSSSIEESKENETINPNSEDIIQETSSSIEESKENETTDPNSEEIIQETSSTSEQNEKETTSNTTEESKEMETIIDYEEVDDEDEYLYRDGRDPNMDISMSLLNHFLYMILSILNNNLIQSNTKEQLFKRVLHYHTLTDVINDSMIEQDFSSNLFHIHDFKKYIEKYTYAHQEAHETIYRLLPQYQCTLNPFTGNYISTVTISYINNLSSLYSQGYPLSLPFHDTLNTSFYQTLLSNNFIYSSSIHKLIFTIISEFCEYNRGDYLSFVESLYLIELLLELRKNLSIPFIRSPRSIVTLDSLYNLHETYIPEDLYKFIYTEFYITSLHAVRSLLYYLVYIYYADVIPKFTKSHILYILQHPSCVHTKQDQEFIHQYLTTFSKNSTHEFPQLDLQNTSTFQEEETLFKLQHIHPIYVCAYCGQGNLEEEQHDLQNPLLLLGRIHDTSFEKQHSINGLYMNYEETSEIKDMSIPKSVLQSMISYSYIYNIDKYKDEQKKFHLFHLDSFEPKKSNYMNFTEKGDSLLFQTCSHYIHKNCLKEYLSSNSQSAYRYCPCCRFQFTLAIPLIHQSFYLYNPYIYPHLTQDFQPIPDSQYSSSENIIENQNYYDIDRLYNQDSLIPEWNRKNRDYLNYKSIFNQENKTDLEILNQKIHSFFSSNSSNESLYSNIELSQEILQYYKSFLTDFPGPTFEYDSAQNTTNVAILRNMYQYDLFSYLFIHTIQESEYITRPKELDGELYIFNSFVASFSTSPSNYTTLRPMFVNSLKVLLNNVCNINLYKDIIYNQSKDSMKESLKSYLELFSITFLDSKISIEDIKKYFKSFNPKEIHIVFKDCDLFANMIYFITSFFWRDSNLQMTPIQQVEYLYNYVYKGYYYLYIYQQLQILKFIITHEHFENTESLLDSLQSSSPSLYYLYNLIPLPKLVDNILSIKIPYYSLIRNQILQIGIVETLKELLIPFLRKLILLQLSFTTYYINDSYFYLPSSYEDCLSYLNLYDVTEINQYLNEDEFIQYIFHKLLPSSIKFYNIYLKSYKYAYYLPNINYYPYIRFFNLPKYFLYTNFHTQHQFHLKSIENCDLCLTCCECQDKKDIIYICLTCGNPICDIKRNSKTHTSCLLAHTFKCTNTIVFNTHTYEFMYLGDMRNIVFTSLFDIHHSRKELNKFTSQITNERYESILDRILQCNVWGRNGASIINKFN